nr:hypothetical protein [Pandoravirus belohorizontensis]
MTRHTEKAHRGGQSGHCLVPQRHKTARQQKRERPAEAVFIWWAESSKKIADDATANLIYFLSFSFYVTIVRVSFFFRGRGRILECAGSLLFFSACAHAPFFFGLPHDAGPLRAVRARRKVGVVGTPRQGLWRQGKKDALARDHTRAHTRTASTKNEKDVRAHTRKARQRGKLGRKKKKKGIAFVC